MKAIRLHLGYYLAEEAYIESNHLLHIKCIAPTNHTAFMVKALICVKIQELFRPPNYNYGSVNFTLT